MNYGNNKHYQNEHGQELNEFLKSKLDTDDLVTWYLLQAVKYTARLGKKDALEKDLGKKNDYLGEIGELKGQEYQKMSLYWVNEFVKEFEAWKGNENEK